MKHVFIQTENKNDLVGAKIILEMKEETTGNKAFLLLKPSGEEVILSSKQMYLSNNVRKIDENQEKNKPSD